MTTPTVLAKHNSATFPFTSSNLSAGGAGLTFVVCLSHDAGSTPNAPSDPVNGAYTAIGTVITGGGAAQSWWYFPNASGLTAQAITITGTGTPAGTAYFGAIPGTLTASLGTGGATGAGTGNPQGITSGTLEQASNIVLAMSNSSASGTNTWSMSGTFATLDSESDGNNYWTSCLAWMETTATAAVTATFNGSSQTTQRLVVFKLSGGGAALSPAVAMTHYKRRRAA